MRRFVLRRLLVALPGVFLVVFVVFVLNRFFAADFFTRFEVNPQVSREILERQRRDAGLDRPVLVQYLYWLRGVLFDVRFESPRRPILARPLAVAARAEVPVLPGDRHDGIEVLIRNDGASETEVEIACGAATARARVGPGATATRKLPLDGAATLSVSAPFGSAVVLADARLVEKGLGFSVGWPNLGVSFEYQLPVTTVLGPALLRSFLLIAAAFLFTWLVAIPIGIYCAIHPNGIGDRVFSFIAVIGMAVPPFFFAILLLWAVSMIGDLLPIGGLTSAGFDAMSFPGKLLDVLKHLAVPVLVIGLEGTAALQRIMRGSLLDELKAQYVVTARAKGLSERRVAYVHALRNAVNPLVSHMGTIFPAFVGGSALVEMICAYPGMGGVLLKAIRDNDLYVVLGANLLAGLLLVGGTLLSDILLRAVDPRVEAA